MTVKDVLSDSRFSALCTPNDKREISGVYIGDLLSWVMGRADADCAWITIMSNLNVIAVASLADVSCVILAEGVTLEEEVLSVAKDKEINVITSSLSAYDIAVFLHGALK
jgi:predicted transcriptional regulator